MNIKSRINKIEKMAGVGVDYCQCPKAISKVFPEDEWPEGYTPDHCFNCRKVVNIANRKTAVIEPTADGGIYEH